MSTRLYTTTELADSLGISRRAVEKRIAAGTIQKPEYITGKVKGWTVTQVREIKEGQQCTKKK